VCLLFYLFLLLILVCFMHPVPWACACVLYPLYCNLCHVTCVLRLLSRAQCTVTCALCPVSCFMYPVSLFIFPVSCAHCPVPCVICPVCPISCAQCPVPCVLCSMSCVLCPVQCALCPASYVLIHLTLYTINFFLCPIPYHVLWPMLHVPSVLRPVPCAMERLEKSSVQLYLFTNPIPSPIDMVLNDEEHSNFFSTVHMYSFTKLAWTESENAFCVQC
jgi:hypothetical protein